ncbi:MAG: anti-sigma F factor [Clostridia bacterium]|nr:anti-sigma F factor [Clostridia bacterium]
MKKRSCVNQIKFVIPSLSVNEGVARSVIAAFCAQANPTAIDIADIKCAVSEAITNCIVHGYKNGIGDIYIDVKIYDTDLVVISIKDKGCGIADVKQARQPLFTTDAESERSGMGFTVMESFMDKLSVRSVPGKGTSVTMTKRLNNLHTN